jgi:uncharacterized protein YbaP (TraB family)
MLIRVLSFLVMAFLAGPVVAACNGTDLRTTLTSDEQARLADQLDGVPYATGNHWRATRDGKTVHLVGTMHLADPRLDGPVDRLRAIVQRADLLLLEMTNEDEQAMQTRLTSDPAFLLMSDTTLPELLSEEEWEQMSAALSARGLPPFMAARFQPWYVSMLLAIPPCAGLDDLGAGGMDAQLETIAEGAGVPRAALEDVETIFAAFTNQPRDIQIDMMLSALVDPQVSEDMFETLLAGYFDQATAEGWAVSALLAQRYSPIEPETAAGIFEIIEQQLLFDRNEAWIPVISDASRAHDTVVVAFGAAHLPGEKGVLALLEADGFTLERLPF